MSIKWPRAAAIASFSEAVGGWRMGRRACEYRLRRAAGAGDMRINVERNRISSGEKPRRNSSHGGNDERMAAKGDVYRRPTMVMRWQ